MKEITRKEFEDVQIEPRKSTSLKLEETMDEVMGVTPEEIAELEKEAQMPVKLQTKLIAKLAKYVDYMIEKDLREKKMISDYTRRFIELYNSVLGNVHKELYGEKQITIGSVKVTHSMIMQEIRKSAKIIDVEVKENGS